MIEKKRIASKGEARDPKDKVPLVLRLDSATDDALAKAASKLGLQRGTYAKQLLASGEILKGLLDQNKGQGKFREVHFDQHVLVAQSMLSLVIHLLGTDFVITQEMLQEWLSQPSPVGIATTVDLPSIKVGSKPFRKAFKVALKSAKADLNLAILAFIIAHRPLTSFDGRVAPDIPEKYSPSRDRTAWERFARNSIAYAIITTEAERHAPKFYEE